MMYGGVYVMKKIITLILVGCMALSIGGCSADGIGDSAIKFIQENNPDFSDNFIMKVKYGYIPTISNDVTLGTALDGYLSNTSWQFNVVDNDRIVECDGNGTLYDKDVDVKVKFILNGDGTFILYSVSADEEEQDYMLAMALIRNAFESAGVTDAWDDDKLDQNVDNDMENGLSGILAETSNQSDSQQ